MYESTLELFDKYYAKMEAKQLPGFNSDLALETKKRIEQLDYLYKKIDKKQSRYMDLSWEKYGDPISLERRIREAGGELTITVPEEMRREMEELIFEIELFTESFYYLAGRMRTILRNQSEPLPGLKSFECEGARNVRNKLLEHAEVRDSRVFVQSFGVGGDQGPVLKVTRPEGQEEVFPDPGLYANATEIKVELERLLNNALTTL
jgi:hypothetical protein